MVLGDEQDLEALLDRLVTPDVRQRTNGQLFDRQGFAEHVRQMRSQVGGGRVEAPDAMVDGERLASRFVFTLTLATGDAATLESAVLALTAPDGRIAQIVRFSH